MQWRIGAYSLNLNYRIVNLLDIATVERARGKEYPNGTIYIQISAARRDGLSQFKMLKQSAVLESKYAVVIPNQYIVPEYLIFALERSGKEWRHKYVGNNINIQIDAFKWLKLQYHPDIEAQKFVVNIMQAIDNEIASVANTIQQEKELKRYMIANMFPR